MISEGLILKIERLRDELEQLRKDLRKRYARPAQQVDNKDLCKVAARLAEVWMVEVSENADIARAIGSSTLGDLNIEFQRILTYSDHATIRKKYDKALAAILKDYRADVIVAIKKERGRGAADGSTTPRPASASSGSLLTAQSVFLAHSFSPEDERLHSLVRRTLAALGLEVLTGEKPRAEKISEKVKARIERANAFVVLFTRREKLEGKNEWTTSSWLIDEKAYALAKGKKLVLLQENGVNSIGGLQGDYEYLPFDRAEFADAIVRVVEVLRDRETS